LAQFPVAAGAGRNSAARIAGGEDARSDQIRLSGVAKRHGRVECRHTDAILRTELASDPAHLRVPPSAVPVCLKLAQQIPCVDRRQSRCSGSIALAAKPVAREAGILGSSSASAQGDEFAGLPEPIARSSLDWAARCENDRRCGAYAAVSNGHRVGLTCVPTDRFQAAGLKRLFRQIAVATVGLSLAACQPPPQEPPIVPLADAARGKRAIERVGCGSCHTIEGVRWPQGRAAPVLRGFARRAMIAGRIPNRPDLLAAFVRNAPAVAPGTTMPAIPVTEQESRDIAAYLYESGG
jgi:mono/diheme cytochrome c family protein